MKLYLIALVITFVTQTHGRRTDCRQCKAGHYARRTCNELHDTICAQCPVGTYTPASNTRELCYSCSTCKEGFFVIKPCTFRQDTVCGSCDLKHYSTLNSYRTKCVHKRKVMQNDQPMATPLTSEDALEISGDGDLIVDHGSLKPTVIDDVIISKETVTNTSQLESDALEEGSGGYNISVPSEELESSPIVTSPESILVLKESTTITSNATSTFETLNTTSQETTNITSVASLTTSSTSETTYTEPSSTTSSTSEPTTTSTPEPSSTISSTSEQATTSTPQSSSTTMLTTESEAPDPEPEPEPSQKPEPKQSTAEPTTEATTTQTTTTTQAVTTKTTTTVQTTPEPTTSTTTTKPKDYTTNKDGSIIIDLRGTTVKIIDLRTKKTTSSPKSKTTTARTIDMDQDKGIVIETGDEEEDEKERYDIPDFTLQENEIKEESPLQAGALGSEKMDEEDGIKVGIVIAIVIGAAIIFFLIGFLVSRYCRKKRSGKFNVKNDIENGTVKEKHPTALDYKDGGIYDEIGKETVTPVNNGKPNGNAHSTEDVYAVPDKRKSSGQGSPKIDEQLNKIKFIDDLEEEIESKEGDKLLDDSDEKYSSFASIPNGSVRQNGDVTPNDYVSESSPILSSRDTDENPDVSEEAANEKESDDAEMSPLLEKTEVSENQKEASS